MKTFNCILGVFAILGAVYCLCFPGATFLSSGLVVAILLGVMGICSIFEYANRNKTTQKGKKTLVANGVLGLIFGIGAAVLSVLAMFSTWVRGMLDLMILLMFVFWLIYAGVTGIFGAVAQKKLGEGKMWVFTLVMSIILIVTGLYAASHLLYAAFAIGFMIGIELMVYGVRLIVSVFEKE